MCIKKINLKEGKMHNDALETIEIFNLKHQLTYIFNFSFFRKT